MPNPKSPQTSINITDEQGSLQAFKDASLQDILNNLGPISKEEHDYYTSLPQ